MRRIKTATNRAHSLLSPAYTPPTIHSSYLPAPVVSVATSQHTARAWFQHTTHAVTVSLRCPPALAYSSSMLSEPEVMMLHSHAHICLPPFGTFREAQEAISRCHQPSSSRPSGPSSGRLSRRRHQNFNIGDLEISPIRRHGVIKWSGAEYQLQLRATTKSGKSSVFNVEPIVRRHLAFSMEEWLTGRLEELGCDGAVFAPYLLAVLADADHSRYGVLCMCCCKSAPRRGTHSAHADGL